PGLLQLPVNNALDGKPLDKPQKLDVRWKEQMQFNGETAKFFADVVARHDQGNMLCQEMHVTLSNRVSFSERNPEGQKTEVRYVVCKEFVQLENYEYQLGQLVGIQRAAVQEATLVQATGETTAQGPGTLIAWRKGDGKSPGLAPRAGVQANRALQTSTLEWDYTQVKFSGTMQGNTRERHTTFRDRVHVLHGPVKQSTDAVDIDNLPIEGGWLEGDELRITQHPETRGTPAY